MRSLIQLYLLKSFSEHSQASATDVLENFQIFQNSYFEEDLGTTSLSLSLVKGLLLELKEFLTT